MIDRALSKSFREIVDFSILYELSRGRMNGMTAQKIRTDHESLQRENEKLTRQLNQRDRQQGQSNGKRVHVVEEDYPVQEVKQIFLFIPIFFVFFLVSC